VTSNAALSSVAGSVVVGVAGLGVLAAIQTRQVAFKWLTTILGVDARTSLIHSPTMSSAQPPNQPPNNPPAGEKPDEQQPLLSQTPQETRNTEDASMDTAPDQPPDETWDDIPEEIMALPTEDIQTRTRLIDNDIKVKFPLSVQLFVV
jgi:hypothetical protein